MVRPLGEASPSPFARCLAVVVRYRSEGDWTSRAQAVQTDLAHTTAKQACGDLLAFLNHTQSQAGKHLNAAQASQLITAATRIQAVLGC